MDEFNQHTWLNEFTDRMIDRLVEGISKHKDALWNEHHLVADLEEELVDVANFAYLMYARLKVLEKKMDEYVKGKLKGM